MSAGPSSIAREGYRVVWDIIEVVLRVPAGPPALPVEPGSTTDSFHPSARFLRYLKLWFWLGTLSVDAILLAAWIAILVVLPVLGVILFLPFLAMIVIPGVIGYVALHLRVDSTWYVLSDRSMRLRRGIWFLHETTITFENIQDVAVNQGPVERCFGIAHVRVETAGGGGDHHGHGGGHIGLLEGLDNAPQIRDMILARVKASRSAGLGDDRLALGPPSPITSNTQWTSEHLAILREIRDLAVGLGPRTG